MKRGGVRIAVAVLAALVGVTLGSQGVVRLGVEPPGAANGQGAGLAGAGERNQVSDAYSRLPLSFVENHGQTDERVRYLAQGARYGFFFTPDSLKMSLLEQDGEQGANLSLDFLGANPDVSVDATKQAAGKVTYLRGSAPTDSYSDLPTFGEVAYRELWPGVDLAVRGHNGVLKYEFRVRPGARIDDIRLAYRGADGLDKDREGGLVVDTAIGELEDAPPVSYQVVEGERVAVESSYVLEGAPGGNQTYGFAVGDHDPARELVIDPGLAYATFLGGFGNQSPGGIAVDSSGNAYVTGFTQSPDFPTTPGAFDRSGSANNSLDAFVSKLNPTGTALVYSTFLGGSDFDWGRDLAIDADGNAYVTGQTRSSTFPTTSNAFDRTINTPGDCPRCGIDNYDGFVTKLNASGSGLVYSTFLGGADFDDGMAITVDESERAYVAGQTLSSNFPTTSGAFDTTDSGLFDTFVTKLNASGSGLDYSTYLAGTDNESPGAITVDPADNAVVVGYTQSPEFPTTPGTIKPTYDGGTTGRESDGFVTKLNASGSDLVHSTFLGGTRQDGVYDVELDATGNHYLVGSTHSPEFPTTPGAFDREFDGPTDAFPPHRETFIAKLDTAAAALEYATFFGDAGSSTLALNPDGSVWLAGGTASETAFVTPDAWDGQLTGSSDIYLAKLDPAGTALEYATYLGGSGSEGATDVALDPDGNVYFVGSTRSEDFPVTDGAVDSTYGGNPFISGGDMFVARFEVGPDAPPTTTTSTTTATTSTSTTTTTTTSPPATTTTSPPQPLSRPSLVSPSDDEEFMPGSTITFDWRDVSGAVSYTIQIDDDDDFPSPHTVVRTVSGSQTTVSGLPEERMWWRVRANDSNGNPGPWSSDRRFELED